MAKFYFTYGTEGHPYSGGWTEIIAPNEDYACAAFKAIHPNEPGDCMKCSSVYGEDYFKKTKMFTFGNLGAFCQERITLTVEIYDTKFSD